MRTNLPVTDREQEVLDDHAIVSKTDLDGNITYVNPYFCEVSGFSAEELIGSPQNIVRHPDMPPEAFADLWCSIKAGYPWTGLVKNRCKNGNFYWVKANITPIRDAGRTIGYMSVRVRADRDQVAKAEQAYRAIRQQPKDKPGITIRHGEVVQPGLASLLGRMRHLSLAMRIWACTSLVNTLLAGVCVASLLGSDGRNTAVSYGIFGATFIGLIVNVFLWYTLRVGMLQPLNRALHGARSIAAGDLSAHFETDSTDEVGQLLRALEQMNSNLIATIRDVRMNVETMAVATRQIAAGNADLSGRTEAQAASLEETASSIEEFAATVKQNADNSVEANKLAVNASNVAQEGGVIVADVIATMDDINNSSKKIVDIISLIEGIAFQTNILALNAAVEAARAGEQGRGFAVVAGEVRNLAQRSATAAKDIKNLIDMSVGKVSAGMEQVHRAGATMEQVVKSVQQVTTIMQDISTASREQSIGVDQVNSAIAHLDQVTQQNAALVEEAAAAAASLAQEATGLTQAVSLFNFGHALRQNRGGRAARTSAQPASNLKRLAA
ncbi:PAS domain S-box protein [Duganella sp. LX20W]|uniref:PAS domain S-box protein n=1 Tax=Rugamonas brunnea TaxID=2758569 RepID=A0A7W2IB21_9BURK|nr:methyl-accepting chemotaxis protein [Rugamonas brunnea]MBA5636763.1 PAS domain S-box protein [Rugamonas brunnea]